MRPAFMSRKTVGEIVFSSCNAILLIVFSLTILYPFWLMLLLSFASGKDVTTLGFRLWNRNWSLLAYEFAFSNYGNAGIAYVNSIFRTVLGTVMTIGATMMAAYPLSKKRLPGRNVLTIFILITMFFSGGFIPLYLVIRKLGLMDNRWSLILPIVAQGFYVIIVRNFIMTIDNAYEEAALIDGANYIQILMRVIVPLSKPVIATIALWCAVAHWNAWFDAWLYIKSGSKIVLQLLLRKMIVEVREFWDTFEEYRGILDPEFKLPTESAKAAVVMLTLGPIIFVYPFLQRYFIKGIFIGSLKG